MGFNALFLPITFVSSLFDQLWIQIFHLRTLTTILLMFFCFHFFGWKPFSIKLQATETNQVVQRKEFFFTTAQPRFQEVTKLPVYFNTVPQICIIFQSNTSFKSLKARSCLSGYQGNIQHYFSNKLNLKHKKSKWSGKYLGMKTNEYWNADATKQKKREKLKL